jgi:hypothetical protein
MFVYSFVSVITRSMACNVSKLHLKYLVLLGLPYGSSVASFQNLFAQCYSNFSNQNLTCKLQAPLPLGYSFFWYRIVSLKFINNRVYYFPQVQGSEGRAGMAAIVDHDGSLNLTALAEGMKKALPSYARPLFIRVVRKVDMTGKQGLQFL